jgi:deazaflavin-dependent oxidoreductase (nitroreductase family)
MGMYHNLINSFARTPVGSWAIMHILTPIDKRLIRWTNGTLNTLAGTDFSDNTVLLRCMGARSGKLREIPLVSTAIGEQFVLIASAVGQAKNPDWYYNLKANPTCSILMPQHGEIACIAHEAEGKERERGWAAANGQYSGYTIYQGRTERQIPVMILTPRPSA